MNPTIGRNARTMIHASVAVEVFLSKNITAKMNMKFITYIIAEIDILLKKSVIVSISQVIPLQD